MYYNVNRRICGAFCSCGPAFYTLGHRGLVITCSHANRAQICRPIRSYINTYDGLLSRRTRMRVSCTSYRIIFLLPAVIYYFLVRLVALNLDRGRRRPEELTSRYYVYIFNETVTDLRYCFAIIRRCDIIYIRTHIFKKYHWLL